jgi:glyoxalase superfamily protein
MPTLGSILLGSANPERLRSWYEKAFGITPNADGFLEFGSVSVLVDHRDDVATKAAEGARVILNFHVDDARSMAVHLDSCGVTWLVPVELRGDGWFGTLADPDGNVIQIIELSEAYRSARGKRA